MHRAAAGDDNIGIVLAFIGLILLAGGKQPAGAGTGRDRYPGGAIAIAGEIILVSARAGRWTSNG